MRKDLVSFILINWNNEKYIEKCLKSISKLKGFKKEVIVVDDFSDDNSINSIKTKPDKIILLKHRGGIAHARQSGLNSSTGNYVVFIDSDIEIESFNFNEVKSIFDQDKLIGIVGRYYSPTDKPYNWNRILDIRREDIQLKGNFSFPFNLKRYTTFSGGFSIFDKSKLKKLTGDGVIGLASEDLFQQIEFSHRGYYFYYQSTFIGIHHHYRSLRSLFEKCKSEARGELWLMNKVMSNKMTPPIFDPIYTYPGLLLLGIIFKNPYFLLFNYFPFIFLFIYRLNIEYIYLLIYQVIKDIYKLFWSIAGVTQKKLLLKNICIFILKGTALSFVGKIDWFFRFISKEKITISQS